MNGRQVIKKKFTYCMFTNIIIVHVDKIKSHLNVIMLHVDINHLVCWGQKYATILLPYTFMFAAKKM